MNVGVLKEIKNNENRVALTPHGASELTKRGHTVFVQKNAGVGSGFSDKEYEQNGAKIIDDASQITTQSKLILKIKEPIENEFSLFNKDHLIFTYFHFASGKELTQKMLATKATCIAYETVQTQDRRLPLLAPMSEVAGKMAPQIGAYYLAKPNGGKGILLSRVNGVRKTNVTVLGAGVSGVSALEVAHAMGADVTILELNDERIKLLKQKYPDVLVLKSNEQNISQSVKNADILIGAVLVPGAKAPKIVSQEMVSAMESGSVIVDISIDQGGCIETSHPTSHSLPTYVENGVIHYCVTNMPGAFPRTSTLALTNATLPYVLQLAEKGEKALNNPELFLGVNMFGGHVTNKGVADAFGLQLSDLSSLL